MSKWVFFKVSGPIKEVHHQKKNIVLDWPHRPLPLKVSELPSPNKPLVLFFGPGLFVGARGCFAPWVVHPLFCSSIVAMGNFFKKNSRHVYI